MHGEVARGLESWRDEPGKEDNQDGSRGHDLGRQEVVTETGKQGSKHPETR